MNSILDIIKGNPNVTESQKFLLSSKVKVEVWPKGKIVQKEGDTSTRCYFVKKGLLRSYVIDEKGKEHIFMFAPEKWIIGDFVAISFNTPSELYIDVLEESEVEIFKKEVLDLMIGVNQDKAVNGISVLAKRNAVLQKRVILLMSATAEKRYEDFVSTYPGLIQRVSLKLIASYLGIMPQTLSTLRGIKSKKRE